MFRICEICKICGYPVIRLVRLPFSLSRVSSVSWFVRRRFPGGCLARAAGWCLMSVAFCRAVLLRAPRCELSDHSRVVARRGAKGDPAPLHVSTLFHTPALIAGATARSRGSKAIGPGCTRGPRRRARDARQPTTKNQLRRPLPRISRSRYVPFRASLWLNSRPPLPWHRSQLAGGGPLSSPRNEIRQQVYGKNSPRVDVKNRKTLEISRKSPLRAKNRAEGRRNG